MKSRSLFLLLIIVLNLSSGSRAGSIVKTYYPGDYKTVRKGNYSLVSFENSLFSNKTGEPTLPYLPVCLLLEKGQKAVSIEFSGEELTAIPGEFTLYPYQYTRPFTNDVPENVLSLVVNEKTYHQNSSYPVNPRGHLNTQYLHGYPIANSTFTPLVYNPAQKKLWYYKKVTIKIITSEDHYVTGHLSTSTASYAREVVKKLIQNPEKLSYYPPVSNDTADYQVLIIAPEVFNGHFNALINNYIIRGMKSKVISTASIYTNFNGQDNQEKIRNCIIQEYLNNHIQHVLLAGDVELVPARGFWAQVFSSTVYTDYNIPADLYYAALDGNWNANGDNKWAEPGEDDLYPELSVGRFPVNTVAELENMISKSVHYQNYPIVAECRKPLLAGEKLWDNPLTWGEDYLELLIGEHSDNGYTTHGIPSWHNIQKLYDKNLPSPWTLSDLLTKINQGASFIHHVGHANSGYVMRMYTSSVTDANFPQVNGISHNFIPVYSHGCDDAAFDVSDCIAEHMVNLNTFAVSFIGNSRYGWFNEGTTEGPSEHLHREFINAMYAEKVGQIGAAHTLSKINTAVWVNAPGQWEEGALRWCFYCCNVLGDPAMFVWTDKPMNLSVTHVDTITVNTTSVLVHCDTSTLAMQGLRCILLKDSTLLGSSLTDSNGNVQLPLALQMADTGILTLIVSGYNCLPDTSFIRVLPWASIHGTISYDNQYHSPLDSVFIYLIQQGDTIMQTMSDTLGHYSFENVPSGSYQLKLGCSHRWGGANSSDALQILRHFVHIVMLNGLALKASDIDHNNVTNALDAFAVQKRFVGSITYFPAGDWVFESPTLNIGITGITTVNIHGLCVGDVNKSFIPD